MTAPNNQPPYVAGSTKPLPAGQYQQAPPPGYPYAQPPLPPKRGMSAGKLLLIVLACVVGTVGILGVIGLTLDSGDDAAPKAQSAWDREQAKASAPVEDQAAAPKAGPTPTAADFHLTLKTTDKQCFGSAGCNISVKVEMAYDGPPLDDSDTWEVTYEITGGDDGPVVGSFQVTGDQYNVNEEDLGTAGTSKKLHVKVTDVDKVGI